MLMPLLRATTPTSTPIVRRCGTAVLVFALLLAQGLGLLHRVVHSQPAAAPAAWQAEQDGASAATASNPLAGLFSHTVDESACRLFDAVTGSAVAKSAHDFAPVQAGPAQLATDASESVAQTASLFDARGPPAHS